MTQLEKDAVDRGLAGIKSTFPAESSNTNPVACKLYAFIIGILHSHTASSKPTDPHDYNTSAAYYNEVTNNTLSYLPRKTEAVSGVCSNHGNGGKRQIGIYNGAPDKIATYVDF